VTREELTQILAQAGIRLRKTSGQNFLLEDHLAAAIAGEGEIRDSDVVLEIGTGIGALTQYLCPPAHHVLSVEIDARVLDVARMQLAAHDNLTLLHADVLASKSALSPEVLGELRARLGTRRLRVVANLPYNVATSLVVLLLSADLPLDAMVVMVQLEAAQRFAARPGDEAFGAVSLLCAALCERIELTRRVPPEVFFPRPKVQSAVVRFLPRTGRREGFPRLQRAVRGLFNYRRKRLGKAAKLAAKLDPELAWLPLAVEALELDGPSALRVENLALSDVRQLAAWEGPPPGSNAP
jgi:16S rRNA (adenine1518-N6/adenine1519-N6)-dimethyltransferase